MKSSRFSFALLCILVCCDSVEPKSSAKSIISFKFSRYVPPIEGLISESDRTISLTLPYGAPITSLVALLDISKNATVNPVSGSSQDFTNPVKYTVTAEDGTSQIYTVLVLIDKSGFDFIESFKFSSLNPEVVGIIKESNRVISLEVSEGTSVTALVPTIIISEKASIEPASGVPINFTYPVWFTVTAESGSKRSYLVTVWGY